jgi:hypothetical protein
MKVYEIISENSITLTELEVRGVPIPTAWLGDIVNVIRRGGTAAMVARRQLVEKLTDKYAAALVVARKEGRPDPQVYATLQKDLEAAADLINKSIPTGPNKADEVAKALKAAGLNGKGLKSLLDDVAEGAEKIYAKSDVVPGAAAAGKGLFGKERTEAIKKAAERSKEAKYAASGMIAGLSKEVFGLLQLIGAVGLVTIYYQRVKFYESEYQKFLANPAEGNIYRNANTKDKAYEWYRRDCDHALGQLELELAALLTPLVLSNLVKGIAWVLSFVPILSSVVSITGGLLGILSKAASILVKKSGATAKELEVAGAVGLVGALAWIEGTEAGKNFILYGILGAVTAGIGTVSRTLLEKAAKMAQEYTGPGAGVVNAAGKALAGTTAAGGGPQAPEPSPEEKAEQERNANVPRTLQVVTKGKVKYLNNIQITDQNGKLLSGLDKMIADTGMEAKQAGVPNPFDSIPKDPNTRYGVGRL